jgi:hypothetical protein
MLIFMFNDIKIIYYIIQMNYEKLKIHNSLPVPIKIHDRYCKDNLDYDYECICKYCSNPNKYVTEWDGYSYIWNKCMLCNKRVWYWHQVCSLYGRRSPYIVCFYCRIPFYNVGLKNGEIYKIAKNQHLNKNCNIFEIDHEL